MELPEIFSDWLQYVSALLLFAEWDDPTAIGTSSGTGEWDVEGAEFII